MIDTEAKGGKIAQYILKARNFNETV